MRQYVRKSEWLDLSKREEIIRKANRWNINVIVVEDIYKPSEQTEQSVQDYLDGKR